MRCLVKSAQPTINVCAKIKCPFFNEKSSSSQGCTQYPNSGHCHLTSVFAFTCEQQGLFTASDSALSSVKLANDGWIARNTNQRQLRRCYPNNGTPSFYTYQESSPPFAFPKRSQKSQPISINVLNSIHFEDY